MFRRIIAIPSESEINACLHLLGLPVKLAGFDFRAFDLSGQNQTLVIESGVGSIRTRATLSIAAERFSPDKIILFGACGALSGSLDIGDVARPVSVSSLYGLEGALERIASTDAKDIKRLELSGIKTGDYEPALNGRIKPAHSLSLNRTVKSGEVKRVLCDKFGFEIVDYETFAAAEFLAGSGVEFDILRVVTDAASDGALNEFLKNVRSVLPKILKQIL